MKRSLSISNVLFNLLAALMIGTLFAGLGGATPSVGLGLGAGIFALGTVPQFFSQTFMSLGGGLFMALQKEVWIADIKETLFDNDASWMAGFTDHSGYVSNKTVHVPQAGSPSAVEKNRATLPGTISQRTDAELTYNIDEFTTDPILVKDFDELQVSYSKRQSVLGQHIDAISDRCAEELLNNIAVTGDATASGRVFRTSGAASAANNPHATATGTRKAMTKADIIKLSTAMDNDKVPKSGRYLLVPNIMLGNLFSEDELIRFDYMREQASLPQGFIAKVMGFTIISRSFVVMYDDQAAAAKKAVGAADATTDCLGALAWQSDCVGKAMGAIKVFADEDKAAYYGSVFSAMVPFGGSRLRSNSVGVWAMAQEA